MKNKVGICYFRSLYSQSASSLSIGKFSDYLLKRGYNTKLYLLQNDKSFTLIKNLHLLLDNDIIIYKTNYKDFEYGIRLFENLLKGQNKKFYLVGPFAFMNKNKILEKYNFVNAVINIQNNQEIDNYFMDNGIEVKKNTVVFGIDREIEYLEKGRYINLEASSGCIYNCAFCHIKLMNYNKFEKNIDILVKEIDYLVNTMHKKYLIFNDSIFWKNINDNDRINKFIDLIKKRKIKFYFMIYLSLTIKIPKELLSKLKEIGLIRVFFGVENISKDFSMQNNKYTSAVDTVNFIKLLNDLNISYHIGFILFTPYTKYENIKENLDFLKKIGKLFRPGILVEKMRILPNSKDSNLLYNSDDKIDQAYNYIINDPKAEQYYQIINSLFSNINIRNFEQFFSGINIAITILKNHNRTNIYNDLINSYYNTLELINNKIYKLLVKLLDNLQYDKFDIKNLKNLYSIAEANYIKFMNYLYLNDMEIYESIPHGLEDLNIW